MSTSKFSVGDLVWAKMKGYPPWPARIATPPENLKSLARKKKGHQCCFFFGSENYSWIPDQNIFRHSNSMVPKTMKRTSVQFQKAVAFILKESVDSPDKIEEQIQVDDKTKVKPSVSGKKSKPKVLKVKFQSRKRKKVEEELAQTEDKLQSTKHKKVEEELAQTENKLQSRKHKKVEEELTQTEDKLQSRKHKKAEKKLAQMEDKLQSRKRKKVKKKLAQTEDNLRNRKHKKVQKELAQTVDKLQSEKCKNVEEELAQTEDNLQSRERKKVEKNFAHTEDCSSQKSKRAKAVPKKKKSPENTKDSTSTKIGIDVDDGEKSLPSNISDLASISDTISSHLNDSETPDTSLFLPGYYPECLPKRPKRQKLSEYVERCPTPEFDINNRYDIEDIRRREIEPSSTKIGFLGLGFMGRLIAKRILISGHHLTVWNRSPEKCEEFIEAGAHRAQTPADVVAASDLIFCCLSDTEAVKSIVFDNCGVLSGMDSTGKEFAVLSSVSPDASIAIQNAIIRKNGFYLEAFIQGTRIMARAGKLVVTAAGHRQVFDNSLSCFRSFARDAYYVTPRVGLAAAMNVLLHSLNGGFVHSFATSINLIEDTEGSYAEFLELLQESRLNNALLFRQADAIYTRSFDTDVSVQHVEEILGSGAGLRGHKPTILASLVNEVFKCASMGRYFAHDITAISQLMR